jgi:hypothetical protein
MIEVPSTIIPAVKGIIAVSNSQIMMIGAKKSIQQSTNVPKNNSKN